MRIDNISFGTVDWESVAPTTHKGDAGVAIARARQFGDICVRLVDYSPGYVADHWCSKGHIIFCVDGEMTIDLKDGRSFKLKAGQSCQVADDDGAHRSYADRGARLFIVD